MAVYAIADQETVGGERLAEVVEAFADAGVGWIQVRLKKASGTDTYRWVESCVRRLEGSRARLWVDDRADVAALLPVFGVHVGQEDLPPAAVRRVVGAQLEIGRSTHGEEQFRAAAADPDVDVVALGPIFATRTKKPRGGGRGDPAVGLDLLRRARKWTDKTLVAIGGIDASNIAQVLDAGADEAAMIGALGGKSSSLTEISRNAERLLAAAR